MPTHEELIFPSGGEKLVFPAGEKRQWHSSTTKTCIFYTFIAILLRVLRNKLSINHIIKYIQTDGLQESSAVSRFSGGIIQFKKKKKKSSILMLEVRQFIVCGLKALLPV